MSIKYSKADYGYRALLEDGNQICIENVQYFRSGYWGKFNFRYGGKRYYFGTLKDAKRKLNSLALS